MTLTFKYCVNLETEEIKEMELDRNADANDLIEQVSNLHDLPDLMSVYINGKELQLDDLLRNHFDNTEAFTFSNKKLEGRDIPRIIIPLPEIDPSLTISRPVPITPAPVPTDSGTIGRPASSKAPLITFRKEFTVYTTASSNSFFKGDKLMIDTNKDEYADIHTKLMDLIKGLNPKLPAEIELHIFLPGGIPYRNSSINDFLDATDVFHYNLYVIVTAPLGDLVNQKIPEPCSCKGIMGQLLSPLFPSSPAGLTQIASLLGYFYHDGLNGEHLLLVLAKFGVHFPPMFLSIYRLLEQSELIGLNIISITAPLFWLFQDILSDDIPNEEIFEHTLKCITFYSLIKETEFLKIVAVNLNDPNEDHPLCDYFRNTNQQNHVIYWEDDLDEKRSGFTGLEISQQPDPAEIENIFDTSSLCAYKPVLPLSLHYVYHPTFIQGGEENYVMLFLKEVPNKKNIIQYIDPTVGTISEIDVNVLSRQTGAGKEQNDLTTLIDPNRVDQLIFICIDESRSMKFRLQGGNPKADRNEISRAQIATQLLRAFVEQSYKLRVSSIYGLIAFGDSPRLIQDLTPLSEQFIEKCAEIKPTGKTHLFDALKLACDKLIESSEEEEGYINAPYPNAVKRIIIITDGEDNKSTALPSDLVNTFIANDIKVDTVLISSIDLSNRCCTISKMTAGLSFQPHSIEEGLKLFEQEGFINLKRRHLTKPFVGHVTEAIFAEHASNFRDFDSYAPNQEILNAKQKVPLSTPFNMVCESRKNPTNSFRLNRAISELNNIGHNPNDNFVVYSFSSSPAEWRVFIKGPAGTPFEHKYLNLYVYLPSTYPSTPPRFRFLTIPFHPNVSAEGAVMFTMINKEYKSKTSISTFLQRIVEILANPELDTAINPEAMRLYNTNRASYIAKQRSEPTGEANYQIFITGATISDDVPETPPDEPTVIDQIYMTMSQRTRGKILRDDDDDDLYA